MDEHFPEPDAEDGEPAETSENPDPPRPVRGVRWVFIPAVAGAAIGAGWSAFYAAAQRIDPATPIWVGGVIGLGVGAFLWAAFPYKGSSHRRPKPSERDPS